METKPGRGAYPHPSNAAEDSRQQEPPSDWDSRRLLRELRRATLLG